MYTHNHRFTFYIKQEVGVLRTLIHLFMSGDPQALLIPSNGDSISFLFSLMVHIERHARY